MTDSQGARTSIECDPTIDRQLRCELADMLFRTNSSSMLFAAIACLVCFALLRERVDAGHLFIWLSASLLLIAVRSAIVFAVSKRPADRLPLNLMTFLAFLGGCSWALLTLFWHPELSLATQLTIILFPIVLSVGIVSSYCIWLPTYFAFSLSAQLPMCVMMLNSGDPGMAPLALPFLIMIVGQSVLAINFNKRQKETIRLRLSNESLVADLSEQNARLTAATDEANAANIAKSEFLARMSHEIRTPINGVLGMAHVILKEEMREAQRKKVHTLIDSGKTLLQLIDELLDVARIENGKLDIVAGNYNLQELMDEIMPAQEVLASQKQVSLNWSVDKSVSAWLHGDALRVQQIVLNLVSNSVKFTEQGSIDVRVSKTGREEEDDTLLISVVDTGVGIASDRLDAIFQIFQQADGSITREYGGSGLGLSIAREFAILMDGSIDVSSTPNVGSHFVVSLPYAPVASPEDISEITSSDTAIEKNRQLNVLVAEDNLVNQMVITAMLEGMGCNVTLVEHGLDALKHLENSDVDIVLMDCQMPVMDGLTATQEARKQGYQLPIVAVTANAMHGDRENCLESGMNDYISKPFEPQTLADMLDRWTGNHTPANMVA